jgi:hypothetical protein
VVGALLQYRFISLCMHTITWLRMQVPPEGSSKAESEAQPSHTRAPQEQEQLHQQQPQPPRLPQLPSQQQHAPPQPLTDADMITVRVLSELPLADSQAVQAVLQPESRESPAPPSGQSGTFSRLAVGWSRSEMWLARPDSEGGDSGVHDSVHRPGDITSSGIFKRLDSIQPLRGIDGFNKST